MLSKTVPLAGGRSHHTKLAPLTRYVVISISSIFQLLSITHYPAITRTRAGAPVTGFVGVSTPRVAPTGVFEEHACPAAPRTNDSSARARRAWPRAAVSRGARPRRGPKKRIRRRAHAGRGPGHRIRGGGVPLGLGRPPWVPARPPWVPARPPWGCARPPWVHAHSMCRDRDEFGRGYSLSGLF